ncbi:LCP family protein [Calidifontibacter terrae]
MSFPQTDETVAKPRWSPRRRRRLTVFIAILVVLLLGGGFAYYHLNSNLRTEALTRGGSTNTALDSGKPMNILVLGSDSRTNAADCKIGGGCSTSTAGATSSSSSKSLDSFAYGNADVEWLVHVSADRKRIQEVSVPRDTIVDIPQCTDPATGQSVAAHRGRINSSMQYGPDCMVATMHQVTGLPIDHFAVVDFSGAVTLSNAVGGVDVCVNNDVYDPFSHLKLSKGTHTLKGDSALQFLRTRHGFGDGSDLGRAGAQHLFLAALMRSMTSTSTLVNPVKVYGIADAGTKALIVDKGLGSVAKLAQLGYEVSKVPNSGVQFVTMPTLTNPADAATVIEAPSAQKFWDDLAADRAFGSATPSSSTSSTPGASSSSTSTSATASASTSTEPTATTADKATGCAEVSTYRSVEINGVPMTPTQAYAASPKVPNSAP